MRAQTLLSDLRGAALAGAPIHPPHEAPARVTTALGTVHLTPGHAPTWNAAPDHGDTAAPPRRASVGGHAPWSGPHGPWRPHAHMNGARMVALEFIAESHVTRVHNFGVRTRTRRDVMRIMPGRRIHIREHDRVASSTADHLYCGMTDFSEHALAMHAAVTVWYPAALDGLTAVFETVIAAADVEDLTAVHRALGGDGSEALASTILVRLISELPAGATLPQVCSRLVLRRALGHRDLFLETRATRVAWTLIELASYTWTRLGPWQLAGHVSLRSGRYPGHIIPHHRRRAVHNDVAAHASWRR